MMSFIDRCVCLERHTHTHGRLRAWWCELWNRLKRNRQLSPPSQVRLRVEMLEDRNAPNGLGNSSPFAADDWFDLLHDTTLFANLLWNDYDPDGDTLSITRINGQTYTPGTQITLQDGDLIYGYLTVEQDGSFTFTPTLRYRGQVSFSYTISDGESESTAWVTINVFNNMPQLGDQEFSMLHDRDLVGNLLSGAYDPDGDAIRITHINGQAISYGEPMSLPSGGSLTVWADGTFSYTPPPNFTGTDSFSLTISDDLDSYTAMVNILVTNNAPYAYDASFSVLHDRELTGSALRLRSRRRPNHRATRLRPNQRHINTQSGRHLHLYTEHASCRLRQFHLHLVGWFGEQ
jgi:hypothetical protein